MTIKLRDEHFSFAYHTVRFIWSVNQSSAQSKYFKTYFFIYLYFFRIVHLFNQKITKKKKL